MKYSFKTGVLKFGVVDKLRPIRSTPKKKVLFRMPFLFSGKGILKKSDTDKRLRNHIIKFNKSNNEFSIIKLLTKNELFRLVRKATVYTAAACIALVLGYGSVSSLNITFAKQVIANGTPVGIVKDIDAFETNVNELENELAILSEGRFNDHARLVYITRICFEDDITPEGEIMQKVMSVYEQATKAYCLYIDNVLVCASKDEADINTVLDEYRKQYSTDIAGATVGFNQSIEIKNEYVPIAYLRSKDGIYNAITKTREEEVEYTVRDNDTVWDIAMEYGMSVDEIMQINPEMTDFIKPGDVLKLNESEPLLQIKVCYTETVEQNIPYENERINDDTMTKGRTAVVVQGKDGVKEVTQEVVMINGKKTAVNVINEKVIAEAVNGTIKVGTKIVTGVGTGTFSRPAYGTITARFGSKSSRWSSGRHTGLDIAASYGSPIYASDAGKVTFSGWKGSYGYLVIINHNNGYETYYGHCSKLLVSVGQTVSRGDLIAKVGSTGNSTGNHCHFEVRCNGVIKNPESYLK